MAYCKNCINAVESNLPEGGLYCTMFRSLCGDTIGCSNGVDGKRKEKTNADRIRSMTDEELAEFFTQGYYDGPKFYCPVQPVIGEGECAMRSDCRQCWLDWLKQEAAE